jgi:endonuclease YncB( thermonuclease family)
MKAIVLLLLPSFIFAQVPIIAMDNANAFYVVDGDSISLSMRIKGIDTPEKKQKCMKNKGKVINCGAIATEHLKFLLEHLPGEFIVKPITIGYYGRVLVSLDKGGADVAKRMVADGMARAYGAQYKVEEKIAKQKKIGFWGYYAPPMNPKKWRKKYLKFNAK